MPRILTLTLNPSVDTAAEAEAVRPLRKIRTRQTGLDPGGGGVNVSRVLHALGADTLALVLAGGLAGDQLVRLLREAGVPHRALPIAGETRASLTVQDGSTGREYRFVPEGPEVTAPEWEAALAALVAEPGDWLVGSGSLPRGVPDDFWRRAAAGTRPFVLDTSGAPLRAALGPHVALIKPSRGEFEALVGRPLGTPRAQNEAAATLRGITGIGLVAVTLGHAGALLADAEGVLRLPAPQVPERGAVGAGDSFLAAMVWQLADGAAPREAFAWGLAAGAAAVMQPGTAQPRRADVEALRRAISWP